MGSSSAANRKGRKRGWKDTADPVVGGGCRAVGRALGFGVAPGDTKGNLIVFFSLQALAPPAKRMHSLSSKQLRRQKVMTANDQLRLDLQELPQLSEVNGLQLSSD